MTCAFKAPADTERSRVCVSNCMGSQAKLVNSCEQEGTKKFSIRLNTFFCSSIRGEKLPIICTKSRELKVASVCV